MGPVRTAQATARCELLSSGILSDAGGTIARGHWLGPGDAPAAPSGPDGAGSPQAEEDACDAVCWSVQARAPAGAAGKYGSATVNVAPRPAPGLAADTVPPCSSTSRRTMDRPMPR